ncbi:hypothetical protein CC1G_00687 [Coprinopsis cinerea okayama7|uniref:Uncharacterized protein n=1 Tax=Coprinopsis cinerea (strain Okayama-7 / 130 / ATCC MYA-4618 / FGSC 9003) TaxID=240176 RepID=A8N3P2_COPC7|nr:hypothetical protein CC1G_00687 [Coprinopsis cinerea okayama7\|eukprot:XP_001829508.1 hypothetical protein CC1G_00687 [Coprinopsis cinerea okayama7\
MAELGAGAIGALTTVGAVALNSSLGFSARHDNAYDTHIDQTSRLVDHFEKAYRQDSLQDEEYEAYIMKKHLAQEKAKEYFESIEKFKCISCFRVPAKVKQKYVVRQKKREVRRVIRELRDLYENLITATKASDSSSITATSGSPPGCALGQFKIWEWAENIGAVQEDDGGDAEFRTFYSIDGHDDLPGASDEPMGYPLSPAQSIRTLYDDI